MYIYFYTILTQHYNVFSNGIQIVFYQNIETSTIRLHVLHDLSLHPFNLTRVIDNRIIIVRSRVRSTQSKGYDDYDVLNYYGKVHIPIYFKSLCDIINVTRSGG